MPETVKANNMEPPAKKQHFKTVTAEKKEYLKTKMKAPNTNKAPKLWVRCMEDFLIKCNLPAIYEITNQDLPKIFVNFYTALKKMNKSDIDEIEPEGAEGLDDEDGKHNYRNTTLKAIRAALCQYFKSTRCIDIINNESFIEANETFSALTRIRPA